MLWVACQTSPASGTPHGGSVILPANPGAATAGAGVSQCNLDEAATGLSGTATNTVGAIGLICAPLAALNAPGMAAAEGPGDVPAMAEQTTQIEPSGMGAATGPGGNALAPLTSPDDLPPVSGGGGPGDPNPPSADIAALQPVVGQPGQVARVTALGDDWKTLPTDKLTQAASLRDAPSMDSKVLKTVSGGTVVHYSEHQKSWCHIFYDDGEGWVSTNFIGCGLPKVAKATTKSKSKSTGSGTGSTTAPTSPPIFGTITLPNGLEIKIGE